MLRTTVLMAAVTILVTACSGPGEPAPGPGDMTETPRSAVAGDYPRYVAIGDSYTAGPGIDDVVADSGVCDRSTNNYPAILADKLEVDSFDDVSCSGATTQSATDRQLDALSSSTDLVTVGIGGNNRKYATQLFGNCLNSRADATCPDFVADELPGLIDQVAADVESFLARVARQAPDARVILVGYLATTPRSGTCGALNDVSATSVSLMNDGEEAFDRALAAAADAAEVDYVSMFAAGEGHDACSDDVWTNGFAAPSGDGLRAHPRRAGMQATADAIVQRLERDN